MMASQEKIVKTVRETVAVLWLFAALFVSPLAFLRLTGEKVPLFGVAEAVTLPSLAVAAAGILCLTCGGVRQLYRTRMWQIFGIVQILLLAVACGHYAVGNMTLTDVGTVLFFILVPVVGAKLKTEFEHILPFVSTATVLLLLISGFTSENFTGLTGNWNWTQAVVFALLPGIFLCFKLRYRQYYALGAVIALAAVIAGLFPEMFSRGAAVAIVAAAMVLILVQKIPVAWKNYVFTAAVVAAVAGFMVLTLYGDFNDSRLQLWKGVLQMLRENIWLGSGQFGNRILPFLPEQYYFTPFAVSWHPHPHNEMLNFLSLYGVVGGIFLVTLVYMVCRPAKNDSELFVRWVFLVIFFCGMFDMHCAVVSGAVWAFTCAGIAAAGSGEAEVRQLTLVRSVLGGILLVIALALTLNHFRAGKLSRQGELSLAKGDMIFARQYLQAGLKYEKLPRTLYLLAETELMAGRAYYAGILLNELAEQNMENYLHTRRLRGWSEFLLSNNETAAAELEAECRNYPYSLISARFRWLVLRDSGAASTEVNEAQAYFYGLCKMRGIEPQQVIKLTAKEDDHPLQSNPAP